MTEIAGFDVSNHIRQRPPIKTESLLSRTGKGLSKDEKLEISIEGGPNRFDYTLAS